MRCPVCKADNEGGPQCRRCRADLSLLFALEERRRQALAEASRCAARGQWPQMLARAEEAHRMRRDEDSRRLLALARLLTRDFAGAWRCYAARPSPPSP
jgi:hypothetical protein